MKILAIETSCDETALAIVEGSFENGTPRCTSHASVVHSQVDLHATYGGVFPAMAKREHAKRIISLLVQLCGTSTDTPRVFAPEALERASILLEREPETFAHIIEHLPTLQTPSIDAIAVTTGPGLEPALWVGINTARALSVLWNIPVIGINHMEGHIASVLLAQTTPTFPAVALLISGGHTEIIEMASWGDYTILGATKDDAVGEAFDKVARILGLAYPGGPKIAQAAERAQQNREVEVKKLPRPMLATPDFNFSFSGLKTAVLYAVRDYRENTHLEPDALLPEAYVNAMAHEFQNAVLEVLVEKTMRACAESFATSLIIGGGVIANRALRNAFEERVAATPNLTLSIPELSHTTDNANMIGCAAVLALSRREAQVDAPLVADGSWRVSAA